MSGLQFIVDVIKALAWPAAIVAIVAFLRRPIVDILMQLASGLRRLRSGPSDAEFDRIVSQTRAELTATVSARGPSPAMPVLLRFATAAEPARATRDHAVQFLALVDALLFAISTQREWSLAGPPQMP
jgi:hypothetical protein